MGDGNQWGAGVAGPHKREASEARAGLGAMRRLRSLLSWTAVLEDFLGVACWTETSLIGHEKFLVFGRPEEKQSY